MICNRCRIREATGYMEKTVDGVKTRIYLCPECFKQAQLEMFSTLGDMGLFSGLSGMSGQHVRCSKCGTTLKQIADNCFVGCPNCYVELEGYIKPMLSNIQYATSHIGSSPNKADENVKSTTENEIARLEAQLREVVKEEKYEEAIKLQEKIKKLKEGQQ